MKISCDRTKGFTPIEVKITLESKEELIELWKRLNLATATVDEGNNHYDTYNSNASGFEQLWDKLDNMLKSFNL